MSGSLLLEARAILARLVAAIEDSDHSLMPGTWDPVTAEARAFLDGVDFDLEPREPRLWLWKNFIDDKREYWAFDNLYPCDGNGGDPLVLGEPCGYVLLRE